MVLFNSDTAPKEWYCQGFNGCILFSLINGGYIPEYITKPHLAKVFKPNSDLSKMTLEEKTLYELKAATLWALVSGYYPFEHKESFYTIYTAFMRLIKNKDKINEENYHKKVLNYARKVRTLCDFFANHDASSLNNGTWNAGNHLRLTSETFTSLDDLPYKSLICWRGNHWVVYLGAFDKDSVIVIDPKIHDGFNRIAAADLEGARIIKPENIHCDAKIQNIFFDFCSNPREMLDSLRRREFSEKMAELIKRLDHISFTEHDYNKFIKQSKFFLESLDKEHYRYEL